MGLEMWAASGSWEQLWQTAARKQGPQPHPHRELSSASNLSAPENRFLLEPRKGSQPSWPLDFCHVRLGQRNQSRLPTPDLCDNRCVVFVAANKLDGNFLQQQEKTYIYYFMEHEVQSTLNSEQFLSLCCGKQKDREAIKELVGREGGFWFFSLRSRVLEPESLTLAHSKSSV